MFCKKVKSILSLILILGLLASIFPLSTIFAEKSEKIKPLPIYVGQETQINKYAKVKLEGKQFDKKGKLAYVSYSATISTLPATLDNGRPMDIRWAEKTDSLGNIYYESGDNLFKAMALPNGRVSVTDSNGLINSWRPELLTGTLLTPLIVNSQVKILLIDPVNGNYSNNVLEWTYTITTGNMIFGKNTVTIKRWVRIIEGNLQEFFVFSDNPKTDIKVIWNEKSDKKAVADLSSAVAFDSSKYRVHLNVKNDGIGFSIKASEFDNKVYPVIIDPTSTFTSSSYDGYMLNNGYGATWATIHDAASSAFVYSSSVSSIVGAQQFIGNYIIDRAGLYFDTSVIPANATITTAYLGLYTVVLGAGTYSVIVQSGMPTYPHSPMVVGDYSSANYSGNGGSIDSTSITSDWSLVNLNSTGLSWITKTGTTKLVLRSSYDVNNSAPPTGSVGDNIWQFYSYEQGTGFAPYLYITYTLPVSTPTVSTTLSYSVTETSAYLRGYVTNNGGENCVAKFQYGTTAGYGQESYSQSGVGTATYFDAQITGLTPGTTYHYRAVATNSAGTGNGLDLTFVTLPSVPTGFSATAGNLQNTLNWTKGTGATNTMIRYKTTGYPSSISDGTLVYNSTLATTTHNPLVAGTTYYYSAWSETGGFYSTTYATCYGTPYSLAAPTLETRDATGVGVATADLNGYVSAINQIGGVVTVSFEYDTDSGAPYASNVAAGVIAAPSAFTANIAGLPAATPIYFRAKAVGANGTAYGLEKTFTTGAISSPVMDTTAATAVSLTYMTINGTVTASGGATVTAWFRWGLSADNLNQTTSSVTGLATGATVNCNITGLLPSTTYYFQILGQNSAGIGYGDIVSQLTSSAGAAAVTTNAATGVGTVTATLSGTLTDDGGVDCEVQFEWDVNTGAPYANSTGWQAGKRQGDTFTAVLSGLTVDTPYFFRAQAKNSSGTQNGTELAFTTVFLAPSDFVAKTTGSTTVSLSWTNQSDQTLIVYKTTGFPVDRLDGTQVYFGNSTSTTHSSLASGVTYFYRAWSWSAGDTWSTAYAEDASTTSAVLKSESNTQAAIIDPTDLANSKMYQQPSSARITNLPFYDTVSYMLDTTEGMPDKETFWGVLAMLIALFIGWKTWKTTKTLFVAIAVVDGLLYVFALQGLIPMWIPIILIISAVGLSAALQADFFKGSGGGGE